MGFFKKKNKNTTSASSAEITPSDLLQTENALNISLKENFRKMKEDLGNSTDIVFREFRIGKNKSIQAGAVFTEGLTDTESLERVIKQLQELDIPEHSANQKKAAEPNMIDELNFSIVAGEVRNLTNFNLLYASLLSGDTILLVEGYSQGIAISNKHWEERGVTEPSSQTVVRGPREGFSENIRINTALVRRKIKDPNLWMETKIIGKHTKTNVAVMYINGIVNEKLVKEVNERLDRINIDGIFESGNIEELIEDSSYSPFPTIINTERPDAVAAALLDGRIAILVDGTPFVLIVPSLFIQFFQSPEDYYQRAYIASLVRFLRFVSYGIALLVPAIFIALTTYHQEMIPTALLMNLAHQREGVPFPAFVETILVEITFEVLREAGLRMPRSIGPTMSIVGAFVLGTAAVEAGMITAATVIVVSITAICSYVTPLYDISITVRILRFIFIGLAALFGLFGIVMGLLVMVLHLCSLRSFGVPYMSPLAPFNLADQKDTLFRFPQWKMFTRPRLISQQNQIKEQAPEFAKPGPNKN